MKRFIESGSRSQLTLMPECLEDYIGPDTAVRVVDAFVEALDLAEMGFDSSAAATGRPGYHPGLLLKLYIYGSASHFYRSYFEKKSAPTETISPFCRLCRAVSWHFLTTSVVKRPSPQHDLRLASYFSVFCILPVKDWDCRGAIHSALQAGVLTTFVAPVRRSDNARHAH